MEKKEGKIPCNARIDVDYTSKKPKIKIGYTSKKPKKDAYKQNKGGTKFFILLLVIVVMPIWWLILVPTPTTNPENCNVSLDEKHGNYESYINGEISLNFTVDQVHGINVTCDGEEFYLDWANTIEFPLEKGFVGDFKVNYTKLSLWGIYFFLIAPFLIWIINRLLTKWLVKQTWYQKWLPKHMAGGKNKQKKYYKYKSKDLMENVIVIPRFKNVELTYNTKGDFSKQLEKIKIREYRHKNYKKQKIGKLKVDPYRWYAIFYFKQKPKNGFLEVFYQ